MNGASVDDSAQYRNGFSSGTTRTMHVGGPVTTLSRHNVKAGPPPVAAPERSDGAATGSRAEPLVSFCFRLPRVWTTTPSLCFHSGAPSTIDQTLDA